MYDDDAIIDPRLALCAGFTQKHGLPFIEAPAGGEDELKLLSAYPYSDFPLIRSGINSRGNRHIDKRTLSSKERALVTFNIDTVEVLPSGKIVPTRLIANNGFSMRVRAEFDLENLGRTPSQIDISVKTRLQGDNTNVIPLRPQRGEWEAKIKSLKPNLQALRAQNTHGSSNGKLPLPDFFKSGELQDAMFRVETIGLCWRTSYKSTHKKTDEPFDVAALYEHTEDFNIFTNPHADVVTGRDTESECEFKGLLGVTNMPLAQFLEIKQWSMDRTQKLLLGLNSGLSLNGQSKATRATEALEQAYGGYDTKDMRSYYNLQAITPAHYALLQDVKPENVNLETVAGQMIKMKNGRNRKISQDHMAYRKAIA